MGKNLITLVKTIYGEARGSTDLDKYAVACVIRNRAKIARSCVAQHGKSHPLFGNGEIADVCLKPYQFSCWNKQDPNYALLTSLDMEEALTSDKVLYHCYVIAEKVITEFDDLKDVTEGSTHFHTKRMGWPAAWGKQKPCTVEIGAHLYYNMIK